MELNTREMDFILKLLQAHVPTSEVETEMKAELVEILEEESFHL